MIANYHTHTPRCNHAQGSEQEYVDSALSAGLMLLVSLTHTAIPYAMYFGAMVRLPTQTVALMSYLDPITALILSALVLHEPLSPAGLAGAVLVLGSTILSELWAGKKQ